MYIKLFIDIATIIWYQFYIVRIVTGHEVAEYATLVRLTPPPTTR
jgi:hypothetical protein